MSLFLLETDLENTINGRKFTAHVNEAINIDFSATSYNIAVLKDAKEAELIPKDTEFLHELTEIFPLTEYDVKITQVLRNAVVHVSIYIDIINKKTKEEVYTFDNQVKLSDKDYDYLRKIFDKELNHFAWQTAEEYIRSDIEQYLKESCNVDLFTKDAYHFFSRMVSERYRECKLDGYVDYDSDLMKDIALDVLEEALKKVYEAKESNS